MHCGGRSIGAKSVNFCCTLKAEVYTFAFPLQKRYTVEQQLTTVETAKKLGLLEEEFEKIKQILGRTPNFTELSIFSVMWSEHCSYKNSIVWLKTLPEKLATHAGRSRRRKCRLVDIGDGLACSFKIESHNHPSAIEPYQGAATGRRRYKPRYFYHGRPPDCAAKLLAVRQPATAKKPSAC